MLLIGRSRLGPVSIEAVSETLNDTEYETNLTEDGSRRTCLTAGLSPLTAAASLVQNPCHTILKTRAGRWDWLQPDTKPTACSSTVL